MDSSEEYDSVRMRYFLFISMEQFSEAKWTKKIFLFQKKISFKAKYICDLLPLHISIVCSFVDIVFSTMFKELWKSLCQLATKLM